MSDIFHRPMLATEHTEHDTGAEAVAFALARRCGLPLAGVLPMLSNPEFESVAPQLALKADAEVAARRRGLLADAQAQGVALALKVRRGTEPFAEIVAEASERGADLIVIRRRGKRGLLANLLVGEMVSKVVAHAPCSVLIAPVGSTMWQRRVLVGIDPQSPDASCVELAAAIAAECGLPLLVVCVADNAGARPAAELALAEAMALARQRHGDLRGELRQGRAHQVLVDAAAECGADLLVVSRHGEQRLRHAWIGGTAQKVIGLAPCPVLVHVNRAAVDRE